MGNLKREKEGLEKLGQAGLARLTSTPLLTAEVK